MHGQFLHSNDEERVEMEKATMKNERPRACFCKKKKTLTKLRSRYDQLNLALSTAKDGGDTICNTHVLAKIFIIELIIHTSTLQLTTSGVNKYQTDRFVLRERLHETLSLALTINLP